MTKPGYGGLNAINISAEGVKANENLTGEALEARRKDALRYLRFLSNVELEALKINEAAALRDADEILRAELKAGD